MTENVSRTGMFIRLNGAAPGKRLPGVGSSMCIVVDLPAGTGSSRKYLECEATVVRAEPPQGECQEFGLRVRRMQFRDPDAVSRILSIATGIPESLKLIQ